jgi:sensor histidine kinase YesM
MQPFIQKNRIVLLHLSFWCVYFSFFFYQVSGPRHGQDTDLREALVSAVFHVVFMIIISYINYFYFLPRFLQHKNFGRYFIEYAIPYAILITAYIHIRRYMIDGYTHHEKWVYSERYAVSVTLTALFIVIFVGTLRFLEQYFELEAKRKEIETEKLTSELRFLKAQINPHFLFNTLNNLYYLAFTNSPNTTEVIAKLSQMMRYMIYESNHPKVQLTREIEYMENYISLEKLRLNDQIPINFVVEGNPQRYLIVPLILITFLENAFKHGVSNSETDSWVKVRLLLEEDYCVYTVENSKPKTRTTVSQEKSGIGLQNVQRRLELSYPENYTLHIEDLPDYYRVELKLNLSENFTQTQYKEVALSESV